MIISIWVKIFTLCLYCLNKNLESSLKNSSVCFCFKCRSITYVNFLSEFANYRNMEINITSPILWNILKYSKYYQYIYLKIIICYILWIFKMWTGLWHSRYIYIYIIYISRRIKIKDRKKEKKPINV